MIDVSKVTIGQYVDYCDLMEKYKPKLRELFGEDAEVQPALLFTRYPEYVEAIVKFWTGWDTVKDKDMDLILGLFASIERLTQLPSPIPLKAFEHEGDLYCAPEDLRVLSKELPMGKATFGQVLEALQIEQLMKGDHQMIPNVLATIFLKVGEKSEDVEHTERVEVMRRLPLTKALNAYFFLACSAANWSARISRFSEGRPMRDRPRQVSTA